MYSTVRGRGPEHPEAAARRTRGREVQKSGQTRRLGVKAHQLRMHAGLPIACNAFLCIDALYSYVAVQMRSRDGK